MRERHPLAGQTVKLQLVGFEGPDAVLNGQRFWVEDWAENIFQTPWQKVPSRASRDYGQRIRYSAPNLSDDQDVVYGCFNSTGYLVHNSELLVT